jgi:hypothetical protein
MLRFTRRIGGPLLIDRLESVDPSTPVSKLSAKPTPWELRIVPEEVSLKQSV